MNTAEYSQRPQDDDEEWTPRMVKKTKLETSARRFNECVVLGCTKFPSFGFENDKRATRCKEHMEKGMMNIYHSRCEYQGCQTLPSFGFPNSKRVRCSLHKEEGMVDNINPRCGYQGCRKTPSFGPKGGKRIRCSLHKEEGMIDLVNKNCDHPDCQTRASFGFEIDNKKTKCKIHKLQGMINLDQRRYQTKIQNAKTPQIENEISDVKVSEFETSNETQVPMKAIISGEIECQSTNEVKNIIDLTNHLANQTSPILDSENTTYEVCQYLGCDQISLYGFSEDKNPSKCETHKENGMVNMTTWKCSYFECHGYPRFGFPNDKVPSRCQKHIRLGMIYLNRQTQDFLDNPNNPKSLQSKDKQVVLPSTRSSVGYLLNSSQKHFSNFKN